MDTNHYYSQSNINSLELEDFCKQYQINITGLSRESILNKLIPYWNDIEKMQAEKKSKFQEMSASALKANVTKSMRNWGQSTSLIGNYVRNIFFCSYPKLLENHRILFAIFR